MSVHKQVANVKIAQDYKHYADEHRCVVIKSKRGEKMFLKVLEHLAYLKMRKVSKLSPKYCGLFTLLKRVGDRAYKLDLPKHSKVHPSHLCTRIGSDDKRG